MLQPRHTSVSTHHRILLRDTKFFKSSIQMKKILVSGGTGFIGRHIVAAAREQGFEVTNLSRSTSTLAHHNINVDLCRFSPTISDSFDLVVHLAGVSNNNHKFCNYWQANIVGTYNLLKGLAGAHVSKFILISAASLYNGSECSNFMARTFLTCSQNGFRDYSL